MRIERILLAFILLSACGKTSDPAPTLHLIIATTSFQADDIFRGCQKDRDHIIRFFQKIRPEAAGRLDVRFHSPDFNKSAIDEYLRHLDVSQDDAVLFVYSGHGVRDPAGSDFPMLYLCEQPEKRMDYADCGLSLKWIHDLLRRKEMRMSIAMASSCNHDPLRPVGLNDTVSSSQIPRSPVRVANNGLDLGLLTDYRGHLIVSASRPGREAYLDDRTGSYFVDAFLRALSEAHSWEEVFSLTDDRVRLQYGIPQELQFRSDPPFQ